MSASQRRTPSQLVQELAEAPGAVPMLLTLLSGGGSATREALAAEVGADTLDRALRWAITGHLVRRTEGSGTLDLDQPGTVYALTDVGASLTGSLVELARALGQNAPPSNVRSEFRGGNQRCAEASERSGNQLKASKGV
jgi:hypothetical protein